MKVVVYGTGGRDHCLADKYGDSQHVEKVYFIPGTAGVAYTLKGKRKLIECIEIRDFEEVARFCLENKVDLVDIGSENPLEEGLVDILSQEGIRTIGPRREYVRLESDREFTDNILTKIGLCKGKWTSSRKGCHRM
jgi:phosphoribosylamine-glycine ligase